MLSLQAKERSVKTHRQEFLEAAAKNGYHVEDVGLLLTKKLGEGQFLLLVEANDTSKYILSMWHDTDYDGMPHWEGNCLDRALQEFENFNKD
jgi:hypothetical protein